MTKKNKNMVNLFDKLREFKGEYKKIIWPDFKTLCKQTYAVMIACCIFGILVFVLDALYSSCLKYFISLIK